MNDLTYNRITAIRNLKRKGLSNKEIEAKTGLSWKTISNLTHHLDDLSATGEETYIKLSLSHLSPNPPLTSLGDKWRPIPGWEGFYEINRRGIIRSLPREIIRRNGTPQRFKGSFLMAGSALSAPDRPNQRVNGIKLAKEIFEK